MLDKYDALFAHSSTIKFWPWVGDLYDAAHPKILVLGESHYSPYATDEKLLNEINADRNVTRTTLSDEYLGDINENGTHSAHYVRCYRNTAAMITGQEYRRSDYVWNRLAFYNFFQGIVGTSSHDKKYAPTLVEPSRKAYYEIINILKPDVIIAWGITGLYDWVPKGECEFLTEDKLLYFYKHIPNVKIWHISHPSMSFPYKDFHEQFMQIMKTLNYDITEIIN
jgi:hypothetical protein